MKTQNCLLLLALMFISSQLCAQIVYQTTYGGSASDQSFSLVGTDDGGFLNFGYTSDLGTADFMLVKTDDEGQLEWSKALGGPSGDFGQQVRRTLDNGFIMTGWTASYGAGDDDVLLVKTDDEGTVEWAKTYGRDGTDRGRSVSQTADGGYVIFGHTSAFGLSANDLYLIKTDALGDTVFVKTFGGIESTNENGWWIEETSDGGFITTGNTAQGPGTSNLLMVKFDSAGDTLWTRAFGGEGGQTSGLCVLENENSEYIATGWTNAFGAGGRDVFTVKTDQDGTLIWSKTYGGIDNDDSQGIVIDPLGGYGIVGTSSSYNNKGLNADEVFTVWIEDNGDVSYASSFGGSQDELIFAVAASTSQGIAYAGTSDSQGQGAEDVLLVMTLIDGAACDDNFVPTEQEDPQTAFEGAALAQSFLSDNPTQVLNAVLSVDEPLDFQEDEVCVVSSLSEVNQNDLLTIYPNPSTGMVKLQIDFRVQQVEVINALGALVDLIEIDGQENNIDLSAETPGIYLIKVTTEKGVSTQRLLLE